MTAMKNNNARRPDDAGLRALARIFLEAYQAAEPTTDEEAHRILSEGGFASFQGGLVELTDEIAEALSNLVENAAKVLGPKGANEKALAGVAEQSAHKLIRKEFDLDAATRHLVDAFFEAANSTFDVLLPNYLIQFREDVRSITIGRVRAVLTEDLPPELEVRQIPVEITPGPEFTQSYRSHKVVIAMPRCSWIVTVTGASENAKEEAKWLIDVAISFLRMAHESIGMLFPKVGDIEPHPWRHWSLRDVGILVKDGSARIGQLGGPQIYEVGCKLRGTVEGQPFHAKAELIFDPPKGSLAERISQGLGWLTRTRQAEDRAERFLYCFTAIEALLSSEDKSAPIVQTVSRNAATIWSADIATRVKISKDIRQLYGLRSKIVHAGNRPVLWGNADAAQQIAEGLFWFVLRRADLSMKHQTFIEELTIASYGSPWPPPAGSVPSGGNKAVMCFSHPTPVGK
jgi:hypothetical protein